MSRYIDADKLIDTIELAGLPVIARSVLTECMIPNQPTADVVEADKAQKEIDYWHDKAQSYEQTILKLSLNKADVVEVVRCKDCKHYGKFGMKCNKLHLTPIESWRYCSYGERKDEGL